MPTQCLSGRPPATLMIRANRGNIHRGRPKTADKTCQPGTHTQYWWLRPWPHSAKAITAGNANWFCLGSLCVENGLAECNREHARCHDGPVIQPQSQSGAAGKIKTRTKLACNGSGWRTGITECRANCPSGTMLRPRLTLANRGFYFVAPSGRGVSYLLFEADSLQNHSEAADLRLHGVQRIRTIDLLTIRAVGVHGHLDELRGQEPTVVRIVCSSNMGKSFLHGRRMRWRRPTGSVWCQQARPLPVLLAGVLNARCSNRLRKSTSLTISSLNHSSLRVRHRCAGCKTRCLPDRQVPPIRFHPDYADLQLPLLPKPATEPTPRRECPAPVSSQDAHGF